MKRYTLLLLTFIIVTKLEAAQIHHIAFGKEEAPVTVIEYTSLTCHHCAEFHLHVLPLIKQKYVSTGKLRLIIKPLPLDKDALMAFKLVHSLPEEQQETAMTKMYASQTHWIGKPPETAARMLGLSPEQCKKALENKDVENALLAAAYNAQKQQKVEATPTFYVGQEKIEGAPTIEEFEKTFEAIEKPEAPNQARISTWLN